jgi:predicted permease
VPSPLYLAAFCVICSIGAYGIQKRKRWAWYGGWVFMFFSSGALALPLALSVFNATSPVQAIASLVGLTGAALLWCGWAIWWSRRQREFGVGPKPAQNPGEQPSM